MSSTEKLRTKSIRVSDKDILAHFETCDCEAGAEIWQGRKSFSPLPSNEIYAQIDL